MKNLLKLAGISLEPKPIRPRKPIKFFSWLINILKNIYKLFEALLPVLIKFFKILIVFFGIAIVILAIVKLFNNSFDIDSAFEFFKKMLELF